MQDATTLLRSRISSAFPGAKLRLAIILGSGLGEFVDQIEDAIRIRYTDLPGFPQRGVSGHAGEVVVGHINGKLVMVLAGRAHYYEKGDAAAMRPVLEVLHELGLEFLVLTNAAGSVHRDLAPGSVMMIDDHINYSGLNPLIGETTDSRFVSMTSAYDEELKIKLVEAAAQAGEKLHKGVYMWFSGPSFETPAEVRMAGILGADAVGMSTVPEVILGRFFDLKIAACSVITNYGAGITGNELSHEETKAIAPVGGRKLQNILNRFIEYVG